MLRKYNRKDITGGKKIPTHPLIAYARAKQKAMMSALTSSRRSSRSRPSLGGDGDESAREVTFALGSLGRAEQSRRRNDYTCVDWRAHDLTKPTERVKMSPTHGGEQEDEEDEHGGPEEVHESRLTLQLKALRLAALRPASPRHH